MARLLRIIASNAFFYVTLLLFTLGCAWIATASLYPMAFDEEFHLGLIKIYATSWLPYGIEHTNDMAQYGAATGDPSYLFHYLMSFPYRLLSSAGLSEWVIVAVLRIINLSFVIAALAVFKKTLSEANFSPIVSNLSILLLTFIPVLSMLAGQINYDNLLLLIVAISFLLVNRLAREALGKKRVPAIWLWWLVVALLVGMSLKYAFLPIALAFALWVVGIVLYLWKHHSSSPLHQIRQLMHASLKMHKRTKLLLISGGVISVFFAMHYVTNTVQYGHPIPDCAAVFNEQACTAYGPWNRNRNYVNNLSESFQPLPFPGYMAVEWFPGMTERLTFALAGKTNDFETKQPLPITLIGFVILAMIGLFSTAYRIWTSRRTVDSFTWLVLFVTGMYVGVLSLQLYGEYLRTGQPVAINGRYLLLVLPVFGAVLLDSTTRVFSAIPRKTKLAILIISLALLLVGGAGVSTYIVQSQSHWFWHGWGQYSHNILQTVFKLFTIRWQLFP